MFCGHGGHWKPRSLGAVLHWLLDDSLPLGDIHVGPLFSLVLGFQCLDCPVDVMGLDS